MSTKLPSNINVAEMSTKPPQIQNSASSLPSVFLGKIDRGKNVDEAALIDHYIFNIISPHIHILRVGARFRLSSA